MIDRVLISAPTEVSAYELCRARQGKASCNFTENVLWIEWHRSCCRKHIWSLKQTHFRCQNSSCAEGNHWFANGTCCAFG